MEDDEIRDLVTRLSRPHPSGGAVIERAAIMAEGAETTAVVAWILAHDGAPEEALAKRPSGGLHGGRMGDAGGGEAKPPARYVLPAGALG